MGLINTSTMVSIVYTSLITNEMPVVVLTFSFLPENGAIRELALIGLRVEECKLQLDELFSKEGIMGAGTPSYPIDDEIGLIFVWI